MARKQKRQRRSARNRTEWIGGALKLPLYVEVDDDPPFRPFVAMWMNEDRAIMSLRTVQEEGAAESLWLALLDAMEHPVIGAPRSPDRVRIADRGLAKRISAEIEASGKSIEVVTGPTPEIELALDTMNELFETEGLRRDGERDNDLGLVESSYSRDGRIDPALVGRFFAACAELYRAAPWTLLDEDDVVGIGSLGMDDEEACAVVLGSSGDEFGFVLFDSHPNEGEELGGPTLTIAFRAKADLPIGMRQEIARHRWTVAGPRAYPILRASDEDDIGRPNTTRDFVRATACASAIAMIPTLDREGRLEVFEVKGEEVAAEAKENSCTTFEIFENVEDDEDGTDYDPMQGPNPDMWLELDEAERMDMVREHHLSRHSSHPVPEGLEAHIAAHVIAENQIAMNDPPETRKTLARLISEGLDRHEAIHAIAFVVTQHVMDVLRNQAAASRAKLSESLAALDAAFWLSQS